MPTDATLLATTIAKSSSSSGGSYSFLILIALFALAYFVFLRPARRRQRAQVEARRQCEVGDEVTTTAGLIATVVAVDDDYVTLEVAPGVHSRYVPAAIMRVNTPDVPDDATSGPTGEHEAIHDPEPTGEHEAITEPEPPGERPASERPDGTIG